jgi:phosphate transport system permease protein
VTASSGAAGAALTVASLRGTPRRRRREAAIRAVLGTAAGVSLVVSIAIVVTLLERAIAWLTAVDPSWLAGDGWFPRRDEFDILTLLEGSIVVSLIAMVVAVPLGLGAALYLSEYASRRSRRTLKPILETLAGIPSVVLGYFALAVIQPTVVVGIFGGDGSSSFLAAGLAVGILIVPLVASVSEDALYAVPRHLREAAYGLGARKRTVAVKVVLPAATSGIVAAMILGLSRAIGETMVIAIAAGATGGALRNVNPLEGGQTMTGAISSLAIGSDQVQGSSFAFDSLFVVGLLLFVITFTLNIVSERVVRRVRRVL